MPLFQGFVQLGAGLSVGLAGLAAGFAIGIVGDAGVRGTAQQPRLFVGMILILIFAEVRFACCTSCYQYLPFFPSSGFGSLRLVSLFPFFRMQKS